MRALALVCLASVAAWGESSQLARARKLTDGLRYAEAAKALDAAWKASNNDRAAVLEILMLTGVVQATLNNKAKAVEAFSRLHALAPNYPLIADYGPRVMTPYYEGRSWAADHPVTFTAEGPRIEDGRVVGLSAKVSDSLRLARSVRFHVKADGGPWLAQQAPLAAPSVTLKTPSEKVLFWLELVGERNTQLATVGSEENPQLAEVSGKTATNTLSRPPDPEPVDAPLPSPPLTSATSAGKPSALRPVGYVLVGAGAAAVVVGSIFGLQANGARLQLQAATFDADGRVLSLTQKKAFELEQAQTTGATLANALFIGGGVLAVTGGILWVLGAPPPKIAIAPTPGGLMIAGELP